MLVQCRFKLFRPMKIPPPRRVMDVSAQEQISQQSQTSPNTSGGDTVTADDTTLTDAETVDENLVDASKEAERLRKEAERLRKEETAAMAQSVFAEA